MNAKLTHAYREASRHLEAVTALFKPGVRATLLVRHPGFPERDFLLTDDDFDEAIELIRRRQQAGLQTPTRLPPAPRPAADMTERDAIAAQALLGLLSGSPAHCHSPQTTAARAYAYADAMLAARGVQS